MQPLCVIGIIIPSTVCYSFVMVPSWAERYKSLIFFCRDHIYAKRGKGEKLRRAHDESAIKLIRTALTIFAFITLSAVSFVVYPLYTFIFENAHPMTIPIILPFTDPETDFCYYLNGFNQLFVSLIGIFGNYGIEIVSMMMVNNIWVGVSSIQCALDEFSDLIKQEPHKTLEIKCRLRAILMQIRDLDRYIVQLSDFYYWKFLLQPLSITFSVAASLFCQMMANLSSGYGCAFGCYFQLIILCYMGNIVKISNQRLSIGLWNVPWYMLPPKQQKMLQTMLQRIQNGAVLTIGPFAELDFETATSLTRIIYKFLMLLMRFADNN